MKRLLMLAAAALLALPAGAQSVKVVTVNMDRAYREHYKTRDFQAELESNRKQVQTRIEELQAEGTELLKTLNEQVEQANNQALTEAARTTAQTEARATNVKVQEKRDEIQRFVQQTQTFVNERAMNHRVTVMDEIKSTVGEIARQKGAALAMDNSGRLSTGAPPVLWIASEEEITDAVIAACNKNAPPPATPAAGAPAAGGTDFGVSAPGQ